MVLGIDACHVRRQSPDPGRSFRPRSRAAPPAPGPSPRRPPGPERDPGRSTSSGSGTQHTLADRQPRCAVGPLMLDRDRGGSRGSRPATGTAPHASSGEHHHVGPPTRGRGPDGPGGLRRRPLAPSGPLEVAARAASTSTSSPRLAPLSVGGARPCDHDGDATRRCGGRCGAISRATASASFNVDDGRIDRRLPSPAVGHGSSRRCRPARPAPRPAPRRWCRTRSDSVVASAANVRGQVGVLGLVRHQLGAQ